MSTTPTSKPPSRPARDTARDSAGDTARGADGLAPQDGPGPHRRPGPVFAISVALTIVVVAWGAAAGDSLATASSGALNWITSSFGWAYLLGSLAILVVLVFLAISPYGSLRLGKDEDRPQFKTRSWIAMILSAVMGIGLISYGVAEPVSHLAAPPHGLADPMTRDAAVTAMQFSFFDWGLHAWGIFAVMGLAMAWSTYRKGRPSLVSALLRPILGNRVDGWVGGGIDVFAVFATLFGTTTSLGLGALQINAGLGSLFGVPVSTAVQVVIIAVITLLFTLSAVSGVAKGIRYLSETSMGLASLLLVFIIAVGPSIYLANLLVQSLGRYATQFFAMSLTTPADGDLAFMQWWTYFMLAWWLSWAAFVGVFLARISRGRTIRQFILGVLVVPSVVFFVWFTAFGGTAMHLDLTEGTGIAQAAANDASSAFFATLNQFPAAAVTSTIAIVLVVLFFVSGADANTYVLAMLTCRGSERPATWCLVLWGVLTGAAAIALLLAGGLQALQNMAIVSSAPFLIIVLAVTAAFLKDLHHEPLPFVERR
ncbi:BCCT family transporter [Kineococcus sp. SYSU DK003]|uniref:BCCT family transporter n=1 Tax=Kineococcus sp. SYSU DK003 TaxID=3383124 RepID=UPI003D7EF6F1